MSMVGNGEDSALNNKLNDITEALARIEGALENLTENKEDK